MKRFLSKTKFSADGGLERDSVPRMGSADSAWGFNPISAKIMRGASMGEWSLSRRDSTIVARHEVPGIMRKIARPSGTIEPISA